VKKGNAVAHAVGLQGRARISIPRHLTGVDRLVQGPTASVEKEERLALPNACGVCGAW
jgi:hypothetical protein